MNLLTKIFMYLIIILFSLLLFVVGVTYVILTFSDKRFDTSTVTNNGFALLAALAAVGFSWAKNIESDNPAYLKKYVNSSSRYCLLGAILFIVSSLSKYSVFLNKSASENSATLRFFIFVGDMIYPPFFLFAYAAGIFGLSAMFFCLMRYFHRDVNQRTKHSI